MLLIEFHRWAGFTSVSDLFGFYVKLGFISIATDRVKISDTLREWKKQIEELKAALKQKGN